ncbi:unnamed protein product [Porites evermanni]|uniref:Uncharacterized protein n=1 Tax=Porites evermanni TaxID=104178 RepID=A0ABN8LZ99_9CNID|nr:unnamed protein product [Porites evermanni]
MGDTGPQGDKGDSGPQGPQGIKGETGPQGAQGAGNFSQCSYKEYQGITVSPGSVATAEAEVLETASLSYQGSTVHENQGNVINMARIVAENAHHKTHWHTMKAYNTRPGKKILGVSCSTNNAKEYNLQRVQVGQQYKYLCTCKGQSSLFSGSTMWCKVHYWECPLTT